MGLIPGAGGTVTLPRRIGRHRTCYMALRGADIDAPCALAWGLIDEILDDLMALDGNPHSVPASTPVELVDNDPLDPVQEWFRVGAIGLGWDPTTAQVLIDAHPLSDDDADPAREADAEAVAPPAPDAGERPAA